MNPFSVISMSPRRDSTNLNLGRIGTNDLPTHTDRMTISRIGITTIFVLASVDCNPMRDQNLESRLNRCHCEGLKGLQV